MLYIFDMGGVVTTTAVIIPRMCELFNITKEQFSSFCKNADGSDLCSQLSDGLINTKEFWNIFSERYGKKITVDWWHYLFHPQLNEGTVRIIKALKEKGFRLVCGTNTIEGHYANHIERGDYLYFDQTYASFMMGVSKPNPEFWNIILTAEQVEAKDAVFIDDRKDNCDAAASLGLRAIHFTNANDLASLLEVHI